MAKKPPEPAPDPTPPPTAEASTPFTADDWAVIEGALIHATRFRGCSFATLPLEEQHALIEKVQAAKAKA